MELNQLLPCQITSLVQFTDLIETVVLDETRGQADRIEFLPAMHALWPADNRMMTYAPSPETTWFDTGVFPDLVRLDRPTFAVVVLCGTSVDLPADDPRVPALRGGSLSVEDVPSARHSLLLYGAAAHGEEEHRLYYIQHGSWRRVIPLPADYRHPLQPLYRPLQYDA